jgi:hypothetical protein
MGRPGRLPSPIIDLTAPKKTSGTCYISIYKLTYGDRDVRIRAPSFEAQLAQKLNNKHRRSEIELNIGPEVILIVKSLVARALENLIFIAQFHRLSYPA